MAKTPHRALRLIAAYKAIKALALLVAAIAAFGLIGDGNLETLFAWVMQLPIHHGHDLLVGTIDKLFGLGPRKFLAIGVVLCIYAAEVYQFSVLSHCISTNWQIEHLIVVFALIALILYTVLGGIKRIGKICSWLMPVFTGIYLLMGFYVIGHHLPEIPALLREVLASAFTGSAGVGGFLGSSMMLAMQQGISRSVYSADIGIGYDSIIQSETSAVQIVQQARLSMLGVFIDNLVCTCTLLIALTSGFWNASPMIDSAMVIQKALAIHFPWQPLFMPIFIFVLVYTTLISYLFAGFKCARFLHPRYGEKVYLGFATAFLLFFSFFDQSKALLVMSLAGCMLVCLNLTGIFRLRHEISFELEKSLLQEMEEEKGYSK